MDFKELCTARYSVRNYLQKEVEREKIDYILQCAQLAPSAANIQPWRLFVITSNEAKASLQSAYPRDWFQTAPMYIVVCKDTNKSWKREASDGKDHSDIDAAIIAEHIALAASSIDLGTCWICNFDPQIVSKVLNLPEHQEPVVVFTLGYIDRENSVIPNKKRKPLDQIVIWL